MSYRPINRGVSPLAMLSALAAFVGQLMGALPPTCAAEREAVVENGHGTTPRSASAGEPIQVPRWEPHDFVFRSAAEHANPFTVEFSATLSGPEGVALQSLGFYDGDVTWKLRVAPTREGSWSLVTRSDDPQLDGKQQVFQCGPTRNPKVHGALRIDPKHPHHFVFEDGTRFFLMGYECDWLWALDMNRPELQTLNLFLDKLATHGFDYLVLNAYAHDTTWRRGRTGQDDFGPPPSYAWEGDNDSPRHDRLNLDYWRHYDRVIDGLYQRGIIAHMMIKVYNKYVRWPENGSAQDDLYFRWLVARYAAYPNVVWDFSKESYNEADLHYKVGRVRLIRKHDPYRRLVTVHDDDMPYDGGQYDRLLDYRSDQQHEKWHETIAAQRKQRDWPVVNVELGYEQGPLGSDDKTYDSAQPAEEVCRRAWEVCLAGGYAAYYYTYSAWDVIRPEDNPPGYAYFQQLRNFFEGTGYWLMRPADQLVDTGHCLANPGHEYIVFLNRIAPFTLKVEGAEIPLAAEWYQPFSGKRLSAGTIMNGAARLEPPADWKDGPVALHVGSSPST